MKRVLSVEVLIGKLRRPELQLGRRGMNIRSAVTLTGVLLLASCLALAPAAGQRTTSGLEALTVPERRLPTGCRLQPSVPPQPAAPDTGRGTRLVMIRSPFPTNPWIGREREIVARIARLVDDAASPQPDGPPLDRRQAAAFELRWADGIAEAYRAAYTWAGGSDVEVAGVRFEDEKRARALPPPGAGSSLRGVTNRVVIGPSVVRVSAPGGTNSCVESIRNHIESLR